MRAKLQQRLIPLRLKVFKNVALIIDTALQMEGKNLTVKLQIMIGDIRPSQFYEKTSDPGHHPELSYTL